MTLALMFLLSLVYKRCTVKVLTSVSLFPYETNKRCIVKVAGLAIYLV